MRAFALLLSLLLLPTPPAETQGPLAFTHVTVIDGTGERPKADMTVVVAASHIVAVGRTGKVKPPAGTRQVEAAGKFLMPGLWDMHFHSGSYEEGKRSLAHLSLNRDHGHAGHGNPIG